MMRTLLSVLRSWRDRRRRRRSDPAIEPQGVRLDPTMGRVDQPGAEGGAFGGFHDVDP